MTDKEKDDLIKSLQEQIATASKEKANNVASEQYKCSKCNMEVSFTFILPVIKRSGLCPRCFNLKK